MPKAFATHPHRNSGLQRNSKLEQIAGVGILAQKQIKGEILSFFLDFSGDVMIL